MPKVKKNQPFISNEKKSASKKVLREHVAKKGVDRTLLLKNSFVLTKKMHMKYSRICFMLFRKKFKQLALALCFIMLMVAVLLFLLPKWYIPGVIFVVMALYFYFMSEFGYIYSAGNQYRNLQAFFGELVEMEVEFYPQFFAIKTEKGDREFLYSQIEKRIELERMSILIVGAQGMIQHGQIIDKSAFTPTELERYYDILEDAGVLVS